ncbi:uncharacterized protein LOC143910240 [Arctopsyche grandis]|uniref:uncharacterized protein LOC143910240 n=1 Tax=Arctopsyche grandis TaxID=121162 RepID=UPI00406D9E52
MSEEALIELVKQNKCLYDFKAKDYKDTYVRQTAWESIGRALNMTDEDCRTNWTKLRNCYTNALKRRARTKKHKYSMPQWRHESDMSFLLPFVLKKWSKSFDPVASEDETNMAYDCNDIFIPISRESSEEKLPHIDNITVNSNMQSETSTPNIIMHDIEHPHSSASYQVFEERQLHTPRPVSNKQNYDTTVEDLVEIMKMNTELRSKSIQFNSATDEIEMFFLSIARTVKQLPKEQQIRIKMSVSQLVYEAELSCCRSGDSSRPKRRRKTAKTKVYNDELSPRSTPSPCVLPRLLINKTENFNGNEEISDQERRKKNKRN